MEHEKLLGALGLCRRAGRLALGADSVAAALQEGRARLVLYAQDVSPAALRRLEGRCRQAGCPMAALMAPMAALTGLLHRPVGVLAVTDVHLAQLCRSCLEPARGGHEEGGAE